MHDASSYYISSFSFFFKLLVFLFDLFYLNEVFVFACYVLLCVFVSGSVRCNQWTGPPSLASWYGSVRVPVGWGHDPGAICSPATAMAASKCGT